MDRNGVRETAFPRPAWAPQGGNIKWEAGDTEGVGETVVPWGPGAEGVLREALGSGGEQLRRPKAKCETWRWGLRCHLPRGSAGGCRGSRRESKVSR